MNVAIRYGMGGRFFPGNWRSPLTEITFAAEAGFSVLQLRCDDPGDLSEVLRTPLPEVVRALEEAHLATTIELLVQIDAAGRTPGGRTLREVLERELPTITTLGSETVHVHLVGPPSLTAGERADMTAAAIADISACVAIAERSGFQFAFEHNADGAVPFADLADCLAALEQIPDLGFVWDTNHTSAEDQPRILAFFERAVLVHVSDTMLPRTNDHLPIGLGTLDLSQLATALAAGSLDCPVVLEIGGLPQSGGYGRDTDEALVDSLSRLRTMVDAAVSQSRAGI